MKVSLKLRARSVDGVSCPFPVVKLRVRDKYGTLAQVEFRVDTQADFTVLPLQIARQEGLPFSEENRRMVYSLAGGTEAYRGRIRVVIGGCEHDWPCEFVKLPIQGQPGQP